MVTFQDIKQALTDYDSQKGLNRKLFGDQANIQKLRRYFKGLPPTPTGCDRELTNHELAELGKIINASFNKQSTPSWFAFNKLNRKLGSLLPQDLQNKRARTTALKANKNRALNGALKLYLDYYQQPGKSVSVYNRLKKIKDEISSRKTISFDNLYEFCCLIAFNDAPTPTQYSHDLKRWVVMLSQYGLLTPENIVALLKNNQLINKNEFAVEQASDALRVYRPAQKMLSLLLSAKNPLAFLDAISEFNDKKSKKLPLKYAEALDMLAKHDNPVDLVKAWRYLSEGNIPSTRFKKKKPLVKKEYFEFLAKQKNPYAIVSAVYRFSLRNEIEDTFNKLIANKITMDDVYNPHMKFLFSEDDHRLLKKYGTHENLLSIIVAFDMIQFYCRIYDFYSQTYKLSSHWDPRINPLKKRIMSHPNPIDLAHSIHEHFPFFVSAGTINLSYPAMLDFEDDLKRAYIKPFTDKLYKHPIKLYAPNYGGYDPITYWVKRHSYIYKIHGSSITFAINRLMRKYKANVVKNILKDKDVYAIAITMLESYQCATKEAIALLAKHAEPVNLAEMFILLKKINLLTPETMRYVFDCKSVGELPSALNSFASEGKQIATPVYIKALAKSRDPQELCKTIIKLKYDLLGRPRKINISIKSFHEYCKIVIKHPHPDFFREVISCLSRDRLFNKSNFEKLSEITNLEQISRMVWNLHCSKLLNQANFELLLEYKAYWNTNITRAFDDVPEHVLSQALFDRIITFIRQNPTMPVETIQERIVTMLNIVRDQAVHQPGQAQANAFNPGQSTHTASVHQSVSESAKRLMAIYGDQIDTEEKLSRILKDISKWANTLPISADPTNKENAARNGFKRLSKSDFVDPASNVSTRQLLALFWLALHEESYQKRVKNLTAKEEKPQKAFKKQLFMPLIEGLYESAREYNLDAQGNDKGGVSKAACQAGSFNKLMEKMVDVHPTVEVTTFTEETTRVRLQKLVVEKAIAYLQKINDDALSELEKLKGQEDELTMQTTADFVVWESIKDEVIQTIIDEGYREKAYANKDALFKKNMEGGYVAFQGEFAVDQLVEKERERRTALAKKAEEAPVAEAPAAEAPAAKAVEAKSPATIEKEGKENLLSKMNKSTHRKARKSPRLFDKHSTEQPTARPLQPSKKNGRTS